MCYENDKYKMLLLISIFTCLVAYVLYNYFLTISNSKKQGLSFLRPWPIVGHLGPYLIGRSGMTDTLQYHYNAFPKKRYLAFFMPMSAEIMIRDPELIKQVLVKDFASFANHRPMIEEGVDPTWNNNLLAIRDKERWQNTRATLSPAFTSSKMKIMFGLMKECSAKFTAHFSKQQGTIALEMKQTFSKYTNDVITTTAFGVACDSFENPDNEFYANGKLLALFSGVQALKMLFYVAVPKLMKVLRIKLFPTSIVNFFSSVVAETIRVRQEKSIYRPDLINLFMEARKTNFAEEDKDQANEHKLTKPKLLLTDADITAHALVFYFGGFESSSNMMSHAAYELALNPDVQEKLRDEVDETFSKRNDDITYEDLLGMKYLDSVITETLRKWPAFAVTERQASRDVTIEPKYSDEEPLLIKAGQICSIPMYGLQRDPKYYPDPDKFLPERFSDENKHKIVPYTYLPFGLGPRNCIGSRLAVLQAKLIIAEIIRKFEIVPIERTKIPIQISKRAMNIVPADGFWLGLKARERVESVA